MKMLNRATKLIVTVLAALALATLWSVWDAGPARAAGGGAWTTGMFGIVDGQTARINAVCLPPGPCQVEMMFVDSAGDVVSRFGKSQEVRPGQTVFFDTSFEIPVKHHLELRAVGIISNQGDKPKGKDVLFSGEVFDNETGKTAFTTAFEECPCRVQ